MVSTKGLSHRQTRLWAETCDQNRMTWVRFLKSRKTKLPKGIVTHCIDISLLCYQDRVCNSACYRLEFSHLAQTNGNRVRHLLAHITQGKLALWVVYADEKVRDFSFIDDFNRVDFLFLSLLILFNRFTKLRLIDYYWLADLLHERAALRLLLLLRISALRRSPSVFATVSCFHSNFNY